MEDGCGSKGRACCSLAAKTLHDNLLVIIGVCVSE